jgi:hypothetical protein
MKLLSYQKKVGNRLFPELLVSKFDLVKSWYIILRKSTVNTFIANFYKQISTNCPALKLLGKVGKATIRLQHSVRH